VEKSSLVEGKLVQGGLRVVVLGRRPLGGFGDFVDLWVASAI
jgi:hypothetical protein